MDRGTIQSLVKIADDMAIMGTADSKTPITIRFGGGGLIKALGCPVFRFFLDIT